MGTVFFHSQEVVVKLTIVVSSTTIKALHQHPESKKKSVLISDCSIATVIIVDRQWSNQKIERIFFAL